MGDFLERARTLWSLPIILNVYMECRRGGLKKSLVGGVLAARSGNIHQDKPWLRSPRITSLPQGANNERPGPRSIPPLGKRSFTANTQDKIGFYNLFQKVLF